ncbi:MAG: citrate synthase [Campylobacter sp.]|nr:citrate synthase [Campylobacter sp.]
MSEFLKDQYNSLKGVGSIDASLYKKYEVKKGLRNENGTGVLVGLTKVSEVEGYDIVDNKKVPKKGHLYYRGYDIRKIAELSKGEFIYEKTCFLLLFGRIPTSDELDKFKKILSDHYDLPKDFLENIILKNPSNSLMNHIMRCILSLYSSDADPDNIDTYELLKKGISIIAKLPAIISYSLQAKSHYLDKDTLTIHFPKKDYTIAQNLLYMSRNNGKFSDLEAKTLDMCLMVHADHGGGNNSTFTGTVVSSTHTDIYSMISASMASLKGPLHGGASGATLAMMHAIIDDIGEKASDDEIRSVIKRLLEKDYFDKKGVVYGIGHAVYTISDPRCELLKAKAGELSKGKFDDRFNFYDRFEKIAIEELKAKKGIVTCANVDFYSGLVYEMLALPRELFVPIFACARTVGWIAHNIESLIYSDKIIRPATKYVGDIK